MTNHFVKLGHEHIAYIGGPKDYNLRDNGKMAGLRGLKSCGIKVRSVMKRLLS